LYIKDAGHLDKTTHQPVSEKVSHPVPYRFSWEYGRVLEGFQLVYIVKGGGMFETEDTGLVRIKTGTLFLLFPGIWHRYQPDPKTGWESYWVGFQGQIVQNIVTNKFISPQHCICYIGIDESVFNLFNTMIENIVYEKPGFQQFCTGMLMHLLGLIVHHQKQQFQEKGLYFKAVNQAKLLLYERIQQVTDLRKTAKEVNMSYSNFRRYFKHYFGISPGVYITQIRYNMAKKHLYSFKSIGDIALELGFSSTAHFSLFFKKQSGISPLQYRKNIIKNKNSG
jgi:AraC-like DNA-binding protein